MEFTDIKVTDDDEDYMRVDRLYNSISSFSHIFGYGWGSELDAYIVARPDGQLYYTAYGNGLARDFSLTTMSATMRGAMQRVVTASALQEELVGSTDEYEVFKSAADLPDWRMESLYEDAQNAGYVQSGETSVGDIFTDNVNGPARIIRVPEGYQMFMVGTSVQDAFEGVFDVAGRLVRAWVHGEPQRYVSYRWGYRWRPATAGISPSRSLGERIVEMSDYRGNVFHFEYDGFGRVVRVNGGRLGYAAYRYDENGDLRWQRDASGGIFQYLYDNDHDLISASFPQGAPLLLGYQGHDGYLTSLHCPDGTEYQFAKLKDGNGYTTGMRVIKTPNRGVTETQEFDSEHLGVYSYC
ncbi:MAG: hypothetical protein WB609_01505 [Candidatus Cybelea sp.]